MSASAPKNATAMAVNDFIFIVVAPNFLLESWMLHRGPSPAQHPLLFCPSNFANYVMLKAGGLGYFFSDCWYWPINIMLIIFLSLVSQLHITE